MHIYRVKLFKSPRQRRPNWTRVLAETAAVARTIGKKLHPHMKKITASREIIVSCDGNSRAAYALNRGIMAATAQGYSVHAFGATWDDACAVLR